MQMQTNNDLFGDLFSSNDGYDGNDVEDLFPDFNPPTKPKKELDNEQGQENKQA